jgi:D-arabinono-1,4-lactone oxidase
VVPNPDGFHHPADESELVALVKAAYREGRQLRVRGAAHSVAHATYTDPLDTLPNRVEQQSPPAGENVNVMLDQYRGWRVKDEERKLVEADAGIHLGADPSDPTGGATLETSLLYRLWKDKGWTLSDTGGITHQTVSGFTATGSSGGSVQFSVNKNLWGFRVIDGTGEIYEVSREDADPDLFYSMSPSLGLLGVVSKITFQCVDAFNITGQEAVTTIEDCAVDLFGAGTPERPSLEAFLRDAEYARLEWWPQRGAERILTWQCQQIRPQLGFRPTRYEEFTDDPETAEVLISILFTIFGNLDDLSQAKPKLEATFGKVEQALEALAKVAGLGEVGKILARFLKALLESGVDVAITVLEPFAPLIRHELPSVFPRILGAFVSLDADKSGMEKGEPQAFRDWSWQGLPMDNQADDVLVPTEFTELWVPLPRSGEAMRLLNRYFTEPREDHEAYKRTGLYAWELYTAMPTPFWMAASHTTGADEWKDGAFRIDAYWFAANPGDPAVTFYPALWELFREGGIPFRLHWGKFQPVYAAGDRGWVDFFAAHYPRWNDFLDLRARRDPNNIFLTSYYRDRFGLWDATPPRPVVTP